MSRVYRVESWADGDELCVDQVNAEIDALVGEMNGHIDVDNIPAGIVTGAKVEVDAFNVLDDVSDPGPDTIGYEGSDGGDWQLLETTSLACEDGYIEFEGQCTYDMPSAGGTHCEIGVRIAGSIAGRSASTGWMEADSPSCFGLYPVGPGTHTVDLVFRINPGDYESAPAAVDATVNERILWARFVAR